MTKTDRHSDAKSSYVLQDNPAINEMLQRRGAREARCVLPSLERLAQHATIVDLGCGVGTITAFIAASASALCNDEVTVVGVDRDPDALTQAENHCAQQQVSNVRFIEADIHELPAELAEESIDLVYTNAVLMYSPNPDGAVNEIFRILKPGGTAVLRDLEPGGGVWHPQNPLRTKWVELFERAISAMGGTPGISIQLHQFARNAGFIDVTPFGENIRLYDTELREFANQMAGLVPGGLGEQWVSAGWCGEEEAVAIANAWAFLPDEEGAMLGNLWGGVVARKPLDINQ